MTVVGGCSGDDWCIDGRLDGVADGSRVYLYYADTAASPVDSAWVAAGNFMLRGNTGAVRLSKLYVSEGGEKKKGYPGLPLFLEKGKIEIRGDYGEIRSARRINGYYRISGTPANEALTEYMEGCAHFDRAGRLVFDEYGDHLMNGARDRSRTYFEKGLSLTRRIDSLNEARLVYSLDCIRRHAGSEAGLYIFSGLLPSLSLRQIGEVSALFPAELQHSAVGRWVGRQAERTACSAVGALFTDFTLSTPEGEPRRLSEYIGKGEYVLLECWASWCGPCKRDIPHVKEVAEKYGDKGFRVVGISLDTDRESWKRAIEEYAIPWVQLSDLKGFSGDLPRVYGIRGIPTCLLLDPQGRIVLRNARGSWLDRWLIGQYGDRFR